MCPGQLYVVGEIPTLLLGAGVPWWRVPLPQSLVNAVLIGCIAAGTLSAVPIGCIAAGTLSWVDEFGG